MNTYLDFDQLFELCPEAAKLKHMLDWDSVRIAKGSSHNHQAWEGGYLDHIRETMNIAVWLYFSAPSSRPWPFKVRDGLLVMFLHDLEKPFRAEFEHTWKTKEDRRRFRDIMIQQNGISLTPEQQNALRYVEGEYDDYSNKERKMGELAAFCHTCDILSARLWHDKGKERRW